MCVCVRALPQVQRGNKYLREKTHFENAHKKAVAHGTSLQNELAESKQEAKKLKKELADLNNKTKDDGKALLEWQLWWSRVNSNASVDFKRALSKLSRRPPPATDRCWGGGQ